MTQYQIADEVNLLSDGHRSMLAPGPSASSNMNEDSTLASGLLARVTAEPLVFSILPVLATALAIYVWGTLHQFTSPDVWRGIEPFPDYDYVNHGHTGRAIELLFFVTLAVQIRWLGNAVYARNQSSFHFAQFLGMWLFDMFSTPFIIWILLSLLQSVTISLTGGGQFSLGEADVVLFGAISALLGMFVRNTYELLRRLTNNIFTGFYPPQPAT
jgi:hypothetical protein